MIFGLRTILAEDKVEKLIRMVEDAPPYTETCDLTLEYGIMGILCIFFAIFFSAFIVFIGSDQVRSIVYDETFIESLKKSNTCVVGNPEPQAAEGATRRTFREVLVEIMGSEPSLFWLLPMRQ
jgi:hypothetical protein